MKTVGMDAILDHTRPLHETSNGYGGERWDRMIMRYPSARPIGLYVFPPNPSLTPQLIPQFHFAHRLAAGLGSGLDFEQERRRRQSPSAPINQNLADVGSSSCSIVELLLYSLRRCSSLACQSPTMETLSEQ